MSSYSDETRHASRADFYAVFTLCRITWNVSFPVFLSSIRSIRLGVFFYVLLWWALKQIVLICNVAIVRWELVNQKPVAGSKIVMCSRVQWKVGSLYFRDVTATIWVIWEPCKAKKTRLLYRTIYVRSRGKGLSKGRNPESGKNTRRTSIDSEV